MATTHFLTSLLPIFVPWNFGRAPKSNIYLALDAGRTAFCTTVCSHKVLLLWFLPHTSCMNTGGGIPPIVGYTGRLRPNCERGAFFKLAVGKIAILAYERVTKSVEK